MSLDDKIMLVMQQALLGEITGNMRAVSVSGLGGNLSFVVYFSTQPTADDLDSISTIEANVYSSVSESTKVSHAVVVASDSKPIPWQGAAVFCRKPA